MIKMPVGKEERREGFRRHERGQTREDTAAQIKLQQRVTRLQQITGGGAVAFREGTADPQDMQFH